MNVKIINDSIGSKDWCVKNHKSASLSHLKLKQDIPNMIKAISDIKPDAEVQGWKQKGWGCRKMIRKEWSTKMSHFVPPDRFFFKQTSRNFSVHFSSKDEEISPWRLQCQENHCI